LEIGLFNTIKAEDTLDCSVLFSVRRDWHWGILQRLCTLCYPQFTV